MAYQIKGGVIISDGRELLGVSTAGINTALFVGDDIQLDGASGIITANQFFGDGSTLTGIITDTGGGAGGGPSIDGNLNVTGIVTAGGLIVTGVSTFNDNIDLDNNDILNGGTGNFADLVVSGTTTLGTALSFTGADSDEFVAGITTDLGESAEADELVTAQGVVNYVSGQIGGSAILEFSGDDGAVGQVDLANDEVFVLDGALNQIVTDVGTAGVNTLGLSLSTTLVLPGTLAFTGGDGDEVVGGITTDLNESAGADELVTAQGVVDYVTGAVAGDVELTFNNNGGPGVGVGTVNLGTQELQITGKLNEIDVIINGEPGTIDVNLADNVRVPVSFGFALSQSEENFTGITTDLDARAGATDAATAEAIKDYVDAQVGGATNAETVNTADNQDNVEYSVSFVSATGAGASVYTDATQLNYNPSTGTLNAQEFNSLSDARFKENITTIDGAVAKLAELRGVEFDWVHSPGSSVGVIAQEVKEVYPQLVTEGEEKITVNYNGLTGLLIQAVKELTARIEELESK